MMLTFALLAILSATPATPATQGTDDFDCADAQNHAEAANRLALGEVLSPRLGWPVPDWAFAEMPWNAVSGLARTGELVAASVAAAAVEAAIQAESDAASSTEKAREAWQTALDWIKVGESIKDKSKPSPFDSKMSPFGLDGDND
jgi:hypothetical protein